MQRHSVDDLDCEEWIAAGCAEHLRDTRIEVGAEAIPCDIGNRRIGQRAESDVFHFNTIGGARSKTDVIGSAGQYPHDGDADDPRDQCPQGISADAIGPLHVVDSEQ